MFVHTQDGVQSASTGTKYLKGTVRHRFTGNYNGTKEEYIRAAHSSGYGGMYKRRTLERMGVYNLKKGFGAVFTVATIATVALSGAQVLHLWNSFTADGILSHEEIVRMGVELAEFRNIPKAMSEAHQAITEDGVNLLNVAEEEGPIDELVNGGIEGAQSLLEPLAENGAGVGEFIGEVFSAFFA